MNTQKFLARMTELFPFHEWRTRPGGVIVGGNPDTLSVIVVRPCQIHGACRGTTYGHWHTGWLGDSETQVWDKVQAHGVRALANHEPDDLWCAESLAEVASALEAVVEASRL